MNARFQNDHSAIEPCIRNMWLEKHEQHVRQISEGDPLVLFVGDSLTDAWQYQPSWTKQLAKYRPLNLGIGGDRTQHLLWRLQHLQLPPASVFSVLIGTNNISHNSSQEIVEGIRACCGEILKQCPGSRILLQKILPRQRRRTEPQYRQVQEVVALMDALVDGTTIFGADFSSVFQKDGESEEHLNTDHVLPDHVHFTEAGYEAWAEAIVPELDALLGASLP